MAKSEVFLYLVTRGHRTGKAHEIEIWFVTHDGAYYIVSEKRGAAHWAQNIRAEPQVEFWLTGESRRDGVARVVDDDDETAAAVKAKMDAKYGWSNGLVVEIRHDSS